MPTDTTLNGRRIFAWSAAAATALLLASSSQAAQRHTINPNSPKPHVCKNEGTIPGGTWLQNKPCGYYVGTAMARSSFDNHQNSEADFHYGRSHGNNNFCAWIPPGALAGDATEVGDSCSQETKDAMAQRLTIGKDFNLPPGETDGSPALVDPSCPAFYNYFTSSDFAAGSLHDEAVAALGTETALYRYTTRDDGAVVIRHPDDAIGWVFVAKACFKGPAPGETWTFNNDPD